MATIIEDLTKLANALDTKGLHKAADGIDNFIKQALESAYVENADFNYEPKFKDKKEEGAARKLASNEISALFPNNKYFKKVPLDKIASILKKHGFDSSKLESFQHTLQYETSFPWSAQVGPNTYLRINHYRMPNSGDYEVSVQLS